MKLGLSVSLAALLTTLSGCTAMLPIAGALVLKEAADRYEAANKPAEPKVASTSSADPTIAPVPGEAAPVVESDSPQPAISTRVASSTSSKPLLTSPSNHASVASSPSAQPTEPQSLGDLAEDHAGTELVSHDEEYTEEEIEASKAPPPAPRAQPKPSASRPALTSSTAGNTHGMPDPVAQGNQKTRSAIKTAQSVPTTEAQANESATDSASRILATALKKIPNPQATPATKPAPIVPQKTN